MNLLKPVEVSTLLLQEAKRIRDKKGYSLKKIACLVGLSLNTVVKAENGIKQNPAIEKR